MNTETSHSFTERLLKSRYIWPLAALLLMLIFNLLLDASFLDIHFDNGRFYGNPIDILHRSAPVALLAIGMTVVIATGGIDLSVGAVMAIAGAVCANLLVATDVSLFTLLVAGIASGLLCGLINGALVSYMGIQPIIATLLLMVTGRGIAQLLNDGQIVTFQHAGFSWLGSGTLLGIPVTIWLVLLVFGISQLMLRRTALGLFVEAVGCNSSASRYLGINDRTVKLMAYLLTGFCAALAGIISAADINGSDANNVGLWIELDAILAVVLGGAALSGGRFSIPLSLLGVLIIQTLNTTIMVSGMPSKLNLLIKALAVVLVLLLQSDIFRKQISGLAGKWRHS
ncbi:ABC transporter permease [Rheinheimera aquimaris]|uniref:ABC transporter permease n=1 Tax=Rheinheimera aquimaris TaxID=412437 RepID=UPI003A975102